MKLNYVFIYYLWSLSFCNGYRIFAIFPINGRSHFSIFEQIIKGLAEKGHQVDVISGFPLKEPFPNYTDIVKLPKANLEIDFPFELFSSRALGIQSLHWACRELCHTLANPEVAKIIKNPPNDPPYDLVLTHFVSGYQCFTAIGHVWNVPVVGVVTTAIFPYNSHFIGNPLNIAIAPKNLRVHKERMDFWDRLYNFVMTHYAIYEYYAEAYKQEEIIKKYFGPDIPHYSELEKSVAMILAHSHYSFHGIQPKTPALVEIAGIHIRNDNTTINTGLRKLLDESKHGFIYFSFGTLTKIESFPKEVLEKLCTAFKKVAPVRVIMKSKTPETLPKCMPDNAFTFPWLPQQKLFQHPNLKAFVSHGGGLGTQEASYFGVPVVCFPLFADQHVNCDIVTNKGFGIKLDIQTAAQSDFDYAFAEILTNPKYKEAVLKFSAIYRDRPMKPKDEAVYWIEYVIRHGKNVLRSRAVDMKWWQLELFDVYGFLAMCFIIIVCIVIFTVQKLIRFFFSITIKSFFKSHIRLSKKLN